REAGEDGERAEHDHARVRELLQRVVLSLGGMVRAQPQVVPDHLHGARYVTRQEEERAPFAALHEVREVQQAERDERPGEREMPVEGAREPTAQPAPMRPLRAVERAEEKRASAIPESGVGFVDLEAARDHAGEHDDRGPMREANDPVMTAYGRTRGDGRCRRGAVTHGLNIFLGMRLVMWMAALASLASWQTRPFAKKTPRGDSTDLARLVPRGAVDSTLLIPRVITEPSVVLFWLHAAATLGSDD